VPEAQYNNEVEYIIQTGFQEFTAVIYEKIDKVDSKNADEE
jgi:hypothetical protein